MLYEKLLKELKKANQARKLLLAERYDFNSVKEYKNYLKGKIDAEEIIEPIDVKPIAIRNVHILDRSTSMRGSKLSNAIKGINIEIKNLQKSKEKVEYFQYFIHFGSEYSILKWHTPIKNMVTVNALCDGCTALNQTVGEILNRLSNEYFEGKTLVKIFTDGQENGSRGKYQNPGAVEELIQNLSLKDFTITFVGTEIDVERASSLYSIDKSNTLIHDNTPNGIETAFQVTNEATEAYSKSVVAGEDVSKGFYKKVISK